MKTEKKPTEKDLIVVKKKGYKGCLVCSTVILVCLICVSAIVAFLWYGGHVRKVICSTVEDGSAIWDNQKCGDLNKEVTSEGDGEFKFNVLNDKETNEISDLEDTIISVVEDVSEAVVGIGIKEDEFSEENVIGSGFIITENGLVVTNHHVVSIGSASDYFVMLPGKDDPVKVNKIYRDEVNDIAIIEIDERSLDTIPLGDSEKIKVGQTVIAIGNPLGTLVGTVTIGNVSGIGRDVNVGSNGFNFSTQVFTDVIQTDAAINPGNSGGPLINSNGEVIGVNFATIDGADNLSFALPINRIKKRVDELNKYGNFRIPFLGVEYRRKVVFYEGEALTGASIVSVVAGTPAEDAGIMVNDIIVQFDGNSIEEESLAAMIQKSKIGEQVEIVVLRKGDGNVTLDVTIGDRAKFE